MSGTQEEPAAAVAPAPASSGILILRRLVGGTVGGIMQAACSHPMETVKTRMQQGLFPSVRACVSSTYQKEGFRGFYRGVTPPLMVCGLYNAALFSVNQSMTVLVTPADHPKGTPLPLWRVAVAGQLTAPFAVAVLTPMEVIKVRLQVTQRGGQYAGAFDCLRQTVREEGVRGLFRGFMPTLGTRFFGLPFYFGAYNVTNERLKKRFGDVKWNAPLSGCAAGIAFWISIYPLDLIKTRVQSGSTSPVAAAKSVLAAEGVAGFYRGFAPCMMRAVPANASVWFGIDLVSRWMERSGY